MIGPMILKLHPYVIAVFLVPHSRHAPSAPSCTLPPELAASRSQLAALSLFVAAPYLE